MSLAQRLPLLFILIILSPLKILAESTPRRAIIFGGGCDDPQLNHLIPTMVAQAKGLRKHGWEISSFYSPDSLKARKSDIENLAEASGQKIQKIKSATKKMFLNALDSIIKDPRFKSGGMLLISFNTHGNPKPDGSGHRLCINDDRFYPKNNVDMDLDDPEILKRLRILKKRNVQMGFTDMSCFSGASIPILREFGCVISSQASNRTSSTYGVSGSVSKLLNMTDDEIKKLTLNEKSHLTLEDVYLDTVLHGAEYKVRWNRDNTPPFQQPSSSLFESDLGKSFLEIFSPRPLKLLPQLSKDAQCEVQKESQLIIDNFFSAFLDHANHDLLEKLSGKKIQKLSELKEELRKKLDQRLYAREQYDALGEKEQSILLKISLAKDQSKDQQKALESDHKELLLEIETLQKKYPFLILKDGSDISNMINIITANSYLTERHKWMNNSKRPENFKACTEFNLN